MSEYNQIKFSDDDVVNLDNWIPAGEYNPHNVRPWLLHDHGFILAIVFADCLQDAIDEAVDAGKLDYLMLDWENPDDRADYGNKEKTVPNAQHFTYWNDSVSFLGNAGEPFDIESLGAIELPNPKMSFCKLFDKQSV